MGIFEIRIKKIIQFKDEKLPFMRIFFNKKFHNMGIGQKLLNKFIWGELERNNINFNSIYSL